MDRALNLMVVFFGGGIGCVLRLLIDGNTTSPFTITNVCACLLMGMSYSLICYRVWLTNKFVISFVNVGFLGGLSTITPLAIYVLHTDLVSNWFMALLLLIGQIIFFVVVSVIGYIVTSAVLQYGLHKKRHMSRLESGRNLAIYNSTLPNYHQIKERYEQLKALNINFKESQHDPIVGQLINELKVLTTNHIMTLTSLNRQYIQNLKKEKCVLTPINEFTRISRDESQFIGENEPTYSEQMALIKTMRQTICGTSCSILAIKKLSRQLLTKQTTQRLRLAAQLQIEPKSVHSPQVRRSRRNSLLQSRLFTANDCPCDSVSCLPSNSVNCLP